MQYFMGLLMFVVAAVLVVQAVIWMLAHWVIILAIILIVGLIIAAVRTIDDGIRVASIVGAGVVALGLGGYFIFAGPSESPRPKTPVVAAVAKAPPSNVSPDQHDLRSANYAFAQASKLERDRKVEQLRIKAQKAADAKKQLAAKKKAAAEKARAAALAKKEAAEEAAYERAQRAEQRRMDRAAAAGATAICEDGTLSFSQHHQGTCSWHGGVDVWV